jgi:hypothetical protein
MKELEKGVRTLEDPIGKKTLYFRMKLKELIIYRLWAKLWCPKRKKCKSPTFM